ncbi:MAG: oligosaccharide flippase family protein [Firmicutes bacterium]|nr:oligosaccharide flippase family protein [Bacillota bacterium]
MPKRGRRTLVIGAVALAASGGVTRVVGAVYRVLLVRIAGAEVLGLFQMTMPLYRLAFSVATMGLQVAVVRLVADGLGRKRPQDVRAYVRSSLGAVAVSGLTVALLLALGAPQLAMFLFKDERLAPVIACLGALLIPAAMSAVLRGIVQGSGNMPYIAAANAAEAVIRVPGVVVALSVFLPAGMGPAATGIVAGMLAGELGSLAILGVKARSTVAGLAQRPGAALLDSRPSWRHSRALFRLGIPAMMSGLLNSVMGLINAAIIPRRLLIAGLTQSQATQAFGQMSGMVVPMLYMPMMLVAPVTQVIIPAVAERMARGMQEGVRRLLGKAFLVAGAIGLTSAGIFSLIPGQIGQILYGAPHIAPLIRPLAVAAPFVYLGAVAGGTLYGLGQTSAVMVNVLAGDLTRYAVTCALVSNPAWGILGAVWALTADCAVTAILNLSCLGWFMSEKGKGEVGEEERAGSGHGVWFDRAANG